MNDYYVTIRRAGRTAFLAGPFASHDEARDMVQAAANAAAELDPWTWFDPHGTASLPYSPNNPVGRLNDVLGVTVRPVVEVTA